MAPWAGAWIGGPLMEESTKMALEDVNARADILPSYTLERIAADSLCSAGQGLFGMFQWVSDTSRPIVGVLGPGCSSVAIPLSKTAGLFNLVSLGHAPGSITLSDKNEYPRFLRTYPHHGMMVPPAMAVIRHYKWQRIGILTERHDVHRGITDFMVKEAFADGIEVAYQSLLGVNDDLESSFQLLRKSQTSIIAIWAYPYLTRRILCKALRQNLAGPSQPGVWLMTGFHPSDWWMRQDGDPHTCNNTELKAAAQGYFSFDRNPLVPDSEGTLPSGQTPSAMRAEFSARSNGIEPMAPTVTSYDAVWTWAFALHELLEVQGLTPAQLTADAAACTNVYNTLLSQSFFGASGHVAFDQHGDRTGMGMIIENCVDGTEKTVYLFADKTRPLSQAAQQRTVVWPQSPVLTGVGDSAVYDRTGDDYAPTGVMAVSDMDRPAVTSVWPHIVDPAGVDTITVSGRNLNGQSVVIYIGNGVCQDVRVDPNQYGTLATCRPPGGVRGNLLVIAEVDRLRGLVQDPAARVSYRVPTIARVSITWGVASSEVTIEGTGFVLGEAVYCRTGDSEQAIVGSFVSTTAVRCPLGGTTVPGGELSELHVSQDNGARWSKPVAVEQDPPIIWHDGTTRTPDGVTRPTEFRVGLMTANTDSEGYKALTTAIRDVNQNDGILKGTTLVPVAGFFGAHLNTTLALEETRRLIIQEKVPVIVGLGWSVVAAEVLPKVTAPLQIPVISGTASSAAFSSPTDTPYFVRMYPSNTQLASGVLTLLEHFKWKKIAVIGSSDAYARDFLDSMEKGHSQTAGAQVLYSGRFDQNSPDIDAATGAGIANMVDNAFTVPRLNGQTRPRIFFMETNHWGGCSRVLREIAREVAILALHQSATALEWAKRAAMEINADSSVLRQTRITVTAPPTDYADYDDAVDTFLADSDRQGIPVGAMVIRGSSRVAKQHNRTGVPRNILSVTPFGSSDYLASPDTYPLLVNTGYSDKTMITAIANLMVTFSFRRATILTTKTSSWASSMGETLKTTVRGVVFREVDCSAGLATAVDWQQVAAFSKILVVSLYGSNSWGPCIKAAAAAFSGFQFVIPYALWAGRTYVAQDPALHPLINGSIGVSGEALFDQDTNRYTRFMAYWTENHPSIAATIPQIDDIGLLLYDTIYVIAKGIDRCLAEEKWIYGVGKSRTAVGSDLRPCIMDQYIDALSGTFSWRRTVSNTVTSSSGFPMVNFNFKPNATVSPDRSWEWLTVVGTATGQDIAVQVCPFQSGVGSIGDSCQHEIMPPTLTVLAPVGEGSFRVRWRHERPSDSLLLVGYSILIKDYSSGVAVPEERETEVSSAATELVMPVFADAAAAAASVWAPASVLSTSASSSSLPRFAGAILGHRYEVRVKALYTQNVLSLSSLARTVCVARPSEMNTCRAGLEEYNSLGQPRLPPELWRNIPCPDGGVCHGKVWESIRSKPGYYMLLPKCARTSGLESAFVIADTGDPCSAEPRLHPCGGPLVGGESFGFSSAWNDLSGPSCPGSAALVAPGDPIVATTSAGGGATPTSSSSSSASATTENNGKPTTAPYWTVTSQCSVGYTGLLCAACEDGYVKGPGGTCEKCAMDLDSNRSIVAFIILAVSGLIVLVWLLLKRPPKDSSPLETALKEAILHADDDTPAGDQPKETIRDRFMKIAGQDAALDRHEFANFIADLDVKMPGDGDGGGASKPCQCRRSLRRRTRKDEGKRAARLHRDADKLFHRMDWRDHNGEVSWLEFQGYILGVPRKRVRKGRGFCAVCFRHIAAWAYRPATATLLVITIAYMQVYWAIEKQFPAMRSARFDSACAARKQAVASSDDEMYGTVLTAPSLVSRGTEGFNEFVDVLTSADASAMAVYRCSVGSRWSQVVVAGTLAPIGGIVGVTVLAIALGRLRRNKRFSESRVLADIQDLCNFLASTLIFLTYPSVCRTALSTFKCATFATNTVPAGTKGAVHVEHWLTGDATVECIPSNPEYGGMMAYSLVVFVIFSLGLPILVPVQLWSFYSPVNKLHVADEEGRPKPNTTVLGSRADPILKYAPQFWFFECIEMIRKLILTALLGAQLTGYSESVAGSTEHFTAPRRLLVGATVACAGAFLFALKRPYTDDCCNRAAAAAHVVLMYCYVDAAVLLSEHGGHAYCEFFWGFRSYVVILPFIYSFLESIGIWEIVAWLGAGCPRQTVRKRATTEETEGAATSSPRGGDDKQVAREESKGKDISDGGLHDDNEDDDDDDDEDGHDDLIALRDQGSNLRKAKGELSTAIQRLHVLEAALADYCQVVSKHVFDRDGNTKESIDKAARRCHKLLIARLMAATDHIVEATHQGDPRPGLGWDQLLAIEEATNKYYETQVECGRWGQPAGCCKGVMIPKARRRRQPQSKNTSMESKEDSKTEKKAPSSAAISPLGNVFNNPMSMAHPGNVDHDDDGFGALESKSGSASGAFSGLAKDLGGAVASLSPSSKAGGGTGGGGGGRFKALRRFRVAGHAVGLAVHKPGASNLVWNMYRELAAGEDTPPPSLTMTQTSLRYLQTLLLNGPRAELLDSDQRKIARIEVVRFLSSQERDEDPGAADDEGEYSLDDDEDLQAALASSEDMMLEMIEMARDPTTMDEWRIAMQAARQRYDDKAIAHLSRLSGKLLQVEDREDAAGGGDGGGAGADGEEAFPRDSSLVAIDRWDLNLEISIDGQNPDLSEKSGGGGGGEGAAGGDGSGPVDRPTTMAQWTAAMQEARQTRDRGRILYLTGLTKHILAKESARGRKQRRKRLVRGQDAPIARQEQKTNYNNNGGGANGDGFVPDETDDDEYHNNEPAAVNNVDMSELSEGDGDDTDATSI
eukprot:g913.t1